MEVLVLAVFGAVVVVVMVGKVVVVVLVFEKTFYGLC